MYLFFLKLAPLWKPIFDIFLIAFVPIFIAGFITYLLHPLVEGLHGRGIPRSIAILSIYLCFFGGIGFLLYKLIPLVVQQLMDLSKNLPYFTNTYRSWIEEIDFRTEHFPLGIHQRIEAGLNGLEQGIDRFISRLLLFMKELLNSIILFAIIPFIVFYMLKDFTIFKKAAWYITPRKWRKSGIALLKDIDESLGRYIRGQLFVCLVIGVCATIGLWLSGISYPLILGFIIGVTNIIPYFGPIIGAVPAVIIASTISFNMVIIVFLIILFLQFLEGNVLSPLIVGKSLHMHPVVIIIALLVGEHISGILGLILAVPIIAVLRVILYHLKITFEKKTQTE